MSIPELWKDGVSFADLDNNGDEDRQVLHDLPIDSWIVVTEGVLGSELASRESFVSGSRVLGDTARGEH